MSNRWKSVITNSGLNLLSNVTRTQALNIVAVKAGTGKVAEAGLINCTNLSGYKCDLEITDSRQTGTNAYQIQASLTNNSVSENFNLTQLGVFATLGSSTTQVLFMIIQSTDNGDNIPASAIADNFTIRYQINLAFGNADNINITVNPLFPELYEHTSNTNNPHNVTKTQVGLGNVGNFKAVSTVANQGLTDTEKAAARANIGAGTGNGNSNLALGETDSTAYRGDRGKTAYQHSQAPHAPSGAEVNQNAFSNITNGTNTISASTKTDTLTLTGNNGVTVSFSGKTITLSNSGVRNVGYKSNGVITVNINGTLSDLTVYSHPTSAGNKHIPSGGSSGQILVYSASGTAQWASLNTANIASKSEIQKKLCVVIASYNTTSTFKDYADYTCTESNFATVFNQALNNISAGGEIVLLDGIYNAGYPTITISKNNITVRGVGYNTVLQQGVDPDEGDYVDPIFTLDGDNIKIKNMMLCDDSSNAHPESLLMLKGEGSVIEDVFFAVDNDEIWRDNAWCIQGYTDTSCRFTRIQNCRIFRGRSKAQKYSFRFDNCTNVSGMIISGTINSGYDFVNVDFKNSNHSASVVTYGHPSSFQIDDEGRSD